jgi:CHAT domain-containing protein
MKIFRLVFAFALWSSCINSALAKSATEKAARLNQQGIEQLNSGHPEAAIATWQQAEIAYKNDILGRLGTQLNQVQAFQTLGLNRRAKTLLTQINAQLQPLPDSDLKIEALRSLGIALSRIGDLQTAETVLQSSLKVSQSKSQIGSTLLALGNVARSRKSDRQEAIALYKQAATSPERLTQVRASLNQLSLLVELQQPIPTNLLNQIQAGLRSLPPSRAKSYAQVNLAESLIRLNHDPLKIAQILSSAIQQARTLKDARAEAYALGQLGHLYETTQQWSEAQQLTKQALKIAEWTRAEDIAVSWQAQLGRILKQQGKIADAIATYSQAVETLSRLRGDLTSINPDLQFSFRDQIEPIYRELAQLLLQGTPTQSHLIRARAVIEALQLAELNDFFREACLDAKPQQIDQVDPNAGVVYSIVFSDRLAIILSLPGQPLRYYTTALSTIQVEQGYDDLLEALHPFLQSDQPLQPNQKLYDWLIRPMAKDLEQSQVKTLVFVLDGVLQGVPLAALHDGKQFLIEKYSLALTPGLQLLPVRSLSPERLQTLAGGLSQSRQGFTSLPSVVDEVQQISKQVPTSILLDSAFNRTQLAAKISATDFPIVHLATHGQFSSQAEETFLLTWDDRIAVKELEQLVQKRDRKPIELLILSACQTAAGDRRAALGLAGVALRSGARSTIATLWSVQDESTALLMSQLYENLRQSGITRAEALRQAQLKLLRSTEYQHPFYWSPFVLIGNWR